jgi:hypothetical protein
MDGSNLLEIQNYNLTRGMEFVAAWIMVVFVLVLSLSAKSQYELLNSYDMLSALNSPSEKRAREILSFIKSLIFSVLGYQGESRERQALSELRADWITANFGRILARFCIFYFIYIWALILTTRALIIDPQTGAVHFLSYTSKQLFGFFMIAVYIMSNSFFDIVSLYFTIKNLEKINERPQPLRAAYYLAKNLGYCSGFFYFRN